MAEQLHRTYRAVCRHASQTAVLESIASALAWDERTMLPPAAAEHRAEQLRLLAGMIHARWTDPRFVERLERLAQSPLVKDSEGEAAPTIRWLRWDTQRQVRLPRRLVEELAATAVVGQQVWQTARRENDFTAFQGVLEKTIDLKREQAEALGYEQCAYDALLEEYEPGERTERIRPLLRTLAEQLAPLVARAGEAGARQDRALRGPFPIDPQQSLVRRAAEAIGFDFSRGRLDVTAHPFCSTLGPHDCRITTRFDEADFTSALLSVMHEAGHGMYEQGLPAGQFGLPLGQAASLGIHESQSRLWENMVGRGRGFWEFLAPQVQAAFPDTLSQTDPEQLFRAVNLIRPTPIRVEADEVTYNLHIVVRFELEIELLEGRLPVADLPAAWNEHYRDTLGIDPPDHARGVLQDVHWSSGAFGYFPTYTLGNLYAAEFFALAEAAIGPLEPQFARGEFEPLGRWLRQNIHRQGRRHTGAELFARLAGRQLSAEPLLEHLAAKVREQGGG